MKNLSKYILAASFIFCMPVSAYEPIEATDPYIREFESEDYISETPEIEELADEDFQDIPAFIQLDVPEMLQLPELPTGCESVALTIALNYLGYDLDKTTIAEDYLIRNNNGNFILGFLGDPASEEGSGIYPIGLMRTARKYLNSQNSYRRITNTTGTPLLELFHYLAQDIPVIVWGTMYMDEPNFSDYTARYRGEEYQWYHGEHCFVLSGYNLEEHTVTFSDPLEGIVTHDIDDFENIFKQTGQMSMIIAD